MCNAHPRRSFISASHYALRVTGLILHGSEGQVGSEYRLEADSGGSEKTSEGRAFARALFLLFPHGVRVVGRLVTLPTQVIQCSFSNKNPSVSSLPTKRKKGALENLKGAMA